MKKALPKLLFLLLLIGVIMGGKKYIDYKTFDYHDIVKESLQDFYITDDESKLDDVIALLDKYKNDENMRIQIQNYSLDIVGSWYMYLDSKYYCDNVNKNSCAVQLDEFKYLDQKLDKLHEKKCSDGFTIIIPSGYSNLKREGAKKMEGLKKVVNNPGAKTPNDSNSIRLNKCAVAKDCDSCNDNICTCFYTDSKTQEREPVQCFVLKDDR